MIEVIVSYGSAGVHEGAGTHYFHHWHHFLNWINFTLRNKAPFNILSLSGADSRGVKWDDLTVVLSKGQFRMITVPDSIYSITDDDAILITTLYTFLNALTDEVANYDI